jgi:hypothetical protein
MQHRASAQREALGDIQWRHAELQKKFLALKFPRNKVKSGIFCDCCYAFLPLFIFILPLSDSLIMNLVPSGLTGDPSAQGSKEAGRNEVSISWLCFVWVVREQRLGLGLELRSGLGLG